MTKVDELIERLGSRTLPTMFDFTGPKVEALFDQGLRHKSGKKPTDYLAVWLSMLRPFAYATNDDSWGELEKLLCIVMRNYVEMARDSHEAAAALTDLQAQVERLSGDGIHTCSDTCQRTACVLRREVTALQAQVAGLREALAIRDREYASCPADSGKLGGADCPKCGATVAGPCWIKVAADTTFADDARQALTQWTGKDRADGTA